MSEMFGWSNEQSRGVATTVVCVCIQVLIHAAETSTAEHITRKDTEAQTKTKGSIHPNQQYQPCAICIWKSTTIRARRWVCCLISRWTTAEGWMQHSTGGADPSNQHMSCPSSPNAAA